MAASFIVPRGSGNDGGFESGGGTSKLDALLAKKGKESQIEQE